MLAADAQTSFKSLNNERMHKRLIKNDTRMINVVTISFIFICVAANQIIFQF